MPRYALNDHVFFLNGSERSAGKVTGVPHSDLGKYKVQLENGSTVSCQEIQLSPGRRVYRHGMPGTPQGQDFTTTAGTTIAGLAILRNQLKDRIQELFGKKHDPAERRLQGIPGHLQQILMLTRNIYRLTDEPEAQRRVVEQEAIQAFGKAAQFCNIDFPPLAIVFPLAGYVYLLKKKDGKVTPKKISFQAHDIDTIFTEWKMEKTILGRGYTLLPEYRGATKFPPANW